MITKNYKTSSTRGLSLYQAASDDPKELFTGTNSYLASLLQPDGNHSGVTIPDLNMTPSISKSLNLNRTITFSAPQQLFVFPFHSPNCRGRRYIYDSAKNLNIFRDYITYDENLQENYTKARTVSAVAHLRSATIPSGSFSITGNLCALSTSGQSPAFSTLFFEDLLSYATDSMNKVGPLNVVEGVSVVSRPGEDHEFFTPGPANALNTNASMLYESNASGPGWSLIPGNSIIFFDSNNAPGFIPANSFGRVRTTMCIPYTKNGGTAGGNFTIDYYTRRVNEDGTSAADVIESFTFPGPINAEGNLATYVDTRNFDHEVYRVTARWVGGLVADSITITNQAYLEMSWLETEARGYQTPVCVIATKAVGAGTSMTLSGQINYEVQPNATLSRQLSYRGFTPEQEIDIQIAESVIANPDSGVRFCYRYGDYLNKAEVGVLRSLATREAAYQAASGGWKKFLGGIKKVIHNAAPIIGGVASAVTGNPMFSSIGETVSEYTAKSSGGVAPPTYHCASVSPSNLPPSSGFATKSLRQYVGVNYLSARLNSGDAYLDNTYNVFYYQVDGHIKRSREAPSTVNNIVIADTATREILEIAWRISNVERELTTMPSAFKKLMERDPEMFTEYQIPYPVIITHGLSRYLPDWYIEIMREGYVSETQEYDLGEESNSSAVYSCSSETTEYDLDDEPATVIPTVTVSVKPDAKLFVVNETMVGNMKNEFFEKKKLPKVTVALVPTIYAVDGQSKGKNLKLIYISSDIVKEYQGFAYEVLTGNKNVSNTVKFTFESCKTISISNDPNDGSLITPNVLDTNAVDGVKGAILAAKSLGVQVPSGCFVLTDEISPPELNIAGASFTAALSVLLCRVPLSYRLAVSGGYNADGSKAVIEGQAKKAKLANFSNKQLVMLSANAEEGINYLPAGSYAVLTTQGVAVTPGVIITCDNISEALMLCMYIERAAAVTTLTTVEAKKDFFEQVSQTTSNPRTILKTLSRETKLGEDMLAMDEDKYLESMQEYLETLAELLVETEMLSLNPLQLTNTEEGLVMDLISGKEGASLPAGTANGAAIWNGVVKSVYSVLAHKMRRTSKTDIPILLHINGKNAQAKPLPIQPKRGGGVTFSPLSFSPNPDFSQSFGASNLMAVNHRDKLYPLALYEASEGALAQAVPGPVDRAAKNAAKRASEKAKATSLRERLNKK